MDLKDFMEYLGWIVFALIILAGLYLMLRKFGVA